jgi:tRNA(Ser,Leu) C12 N-acetylase TAN1
MDRRTTIDEPKATSTTTDLLVSYPGREYIRARNEISHLMKEWGDTRVWVEKTAVWGMATLHGSMNNREIIQRCRERWSRDPATFRFAIKWVPVDYWCETSLVAIKAVIDEAISPRMGPAPIWSMRVHKRRWSQFTTLEIIHRLATDIPGRVDLERPEWIVWVDVVGRGTALSLLRPEEIFAPLSRQAV